MRSAVLAVLGCVAVAGTANANVVFLNFEGLADGEVIGNFYNGGAGGNLGVTFGTTALGLIDADAGGTGNFENEPSADTIMYFPTTTNAYMDVAGGFTTAFSCFYTSFTSSGMIEVFDGPGGTGNSLGSVNLTPLGSDGPADGDFDRWALVAVVFNGTAQSVVYSGAANQMGFDNVTFGNRFGQPTVPLPTSVALSCAGLVAVGLRRRR